MLATQTAVKITGIPETSPFSVLNGRTGHVVEQAIRPFGIVLVHLTFAITSDDIELAFGPDATAEDFGGSANGHQISVLEKYLTDAPIVEPGRLEQDMIDLGLAARSEVCRLARKARRDGGSELWGMVAEQGQHVAYFTRLIPESVVTPEDARAWVHEQGRTERFGF